jgi:hypothetical protein
MKTLLAIWSLALPLLAFSADDGELLYNGIRLPKEWPPVAKEKPTAETVHKIRPIPYLQNPSAVIPIDVGRQLFVDDFLIEKTSLIRTFHYAEKYARNPILKPETPLEMNGGDMPCATLFNDGVWFDPNDKLFKMWYHAGWFDGIGYATSKDGLAWQRENLDVVSGTNRILPKEGHGQRDGCAVWLDSFATDSKQRFKMFLFERPDEKFGGQIFTSSDGTHWDGPTRTHWVGDNTTIFYNPFRKKWVYSIRNTLFGRARMYREHDDLLQGAQWKVNEAVQWAVADELDRPDPKILAMMPGEEQIKKEAETSGKSVEELTKQYRFDYGDPPQLYNLDAVPYESIMLGMFGILRGPSNKICGTLKIPKLTELALGYSRDGFHWHRPDHTPFLAGTQKPGDWDRAYLHSATSICAVVGDKLYFFYGAFSGESPKLGGHIYAGGATGVAFLRRDGFVSMDAGETTGTLTTRPVKFDGRHLFVNVDAPKGELRAEVLDESGNVISPFSAENSLVVAKDSTRVQMNWNGASDLTMLAGRSVKFRFHLRSGQLYAFWVSPDASGASRGYLAAGGPEFSGPMDTARSKQ